MREINIDWIEKMEDGLVKKNPSTKMHLVDGLEATITVLEEQIANAGKVDSVNGKTGEVVLDSYDILHDKSVDDTSMYDVIEHLAEKTEHTSDNVDKLETSKADKTYVNDEIKRVEFSELSSEATNKVDDVYTNVVWKDKSGEVYATSTLIENVLTVKYTADSKVIKWEIDFDEDGFPFKKELI